MTTGGHGIRPLLTTPGKFGCGGRQRQSKKKLKEISNGYSSLPSLAKTLHKQFGFLPLLL